ncbi:MAG TPA: bifunctional UDP-3-O-[3-hydroxymyristoyl] N-acetylglucosamine deacetylase/3-hydroxyacyl-ACP dehydratase [Chitinophagales bacterium]|nr:bifunctional UDP-3-O-[3-hydroxymyristoyl] N-acetylglucosamine deacetylase/3-hydroxyacyl-ACP dehydratase [Chitinophagales bacterium]
MIEWQQTISKTVSFSGKGLHTGQNVTVTLSPAPANSGIVFRRVDVENPVNIKADCDLVVDVSRGTTLEYQGQRVSTVEHLMSALVALNIDNVIVELDAQEVPILDGSALPFIEVIESAGFEEQNEERVYFVLDETFQYYDPIKDVEMNALPFDEYAITVMIDFDSEVIGRQYAQLKSIADFKQNFAAARTFCFLHEVESLLEQGLIKGGELNNAIVISEKEIPENKLKHLSDIFRQDIQELPPKGIVNHKQLRYDNEMARHKLIDIVGDLALIGIRIKGKIIASKPGHAGNIAFAQKLKKHIRKQLKIREIPIIDPNLPPVLDLIAIKKIIPHRIPFLLVDKVIELSENSIVSVKNVTINEPYFEGHFPNQPVMPGVLQIEAMAQTGGILALHREEHPEDFLTYFVKIENCRFKHVVVPGDTMIIKMELLHPIRRGVCFMKGVIYVGQQIVTEAELTAKIFKP